MKVAQPSISWRHNSRFRDRQSLKLSAVTTTSTLRTPRWRQRGLWNYDVMFTHGTNLVFPVCQFERRLFVPLPQLWLVEQTYSDCRHVCLVAPVIRLRSWTSHTSKQVQLYLYGWLVDRWCGHWVAIVRNTDKLGTPSVLTNALNN